MSLISDMKIRNKLLTSSAILSTLFCIAVGVYHLTLTMVNSNYEHLTTHDHLVADKAKAMQFHILKTRKAELEFLRDGNEKYPPLVRSNLQSIQDLATSTIQLASTEAVFARVTQDAKLIQSRVSDYHDAFWRIVEAYGEKGADENSGFYDRFRTIIHTIQGFCLANRAQVPQGMELLLEIRRHEKDYLLCGEFKYQEKNHAAIAHLLTAFKSSELPPEVVDTLEEQLLAYRQHFDQIVAKDKTIAIRSFALIEAAEEIERIADKIISSIEKATTFQLNEIKSKSKKYISLALLFCLIAILIGFCLMYYFNICITRPLATIIEKIKEISAGNYNVVVPVSSSDETGQLATAFNMMALDRKQADEALHHASLVIESSPVVLFRWKATEGWPVEMVTDNVIQFGYTSDELLSGKTAYGTIVHPDDLERVVQEVQKYSDSGVSPFRQEYRIITPEGDVHWIDDRTTVERDEDGNITHYQGTVIDITERKLAEDELRKYREHLEELVEKRTEALKKNAENIEKARKALTYLLEDVNESREMLEKVNSEYDAANKELKEFAYIVSHDLKAPLRAISQLTHWISLDYSEVFDADGKEQMDLILQRVKRMDSLIDGILRYSRVGRIKEKKEQLDLNLLVWEVIDTLAPPDTVQILIENKLPVVLRDPIRMGQVFQNLIGNAIKYMDKDKGIIKVGCADEGEHWKFTVSDNGPGIDKRYHEKIFQIFQTLMPRDEHESTGIGLTLVKKIITLYGGSVWVESEKDHGATFFFTLPKQGEHDEKL